MLSFSFLPTAHRYQKKKEVLPKRANLFRVAASESAGTSHRVFKRWRVVSSVLVVTHLLCGLSSQVSLDGQTLSLLSLCVNRSGICTKTSRPRHVLNCAYQTV